MFGLYQLVRMQNKYGEWKGFKLPDEEKWISRAESTKLNLEGRSRKDKRKKRLTDV